ncbi:Extracellular solute-binding protein, family 7 [Desulfamplus magnetovallimortis]|uniref:Extracellular solute-binding protein, family 7 n=1 Tax=Desulfamplus magnetovallimortis TaxID=1246637 RepID=A0A1W1HD60_9BACT|nr:TRAP transporter substrate-binding protein [Desulfamplus magnetovallimortis]SLM30305.1 Extracellular solute-binding protein, family 7 [Desulfamplus magnetovallimortis]
MRINKLYAIVSLIIVPVMAAGFIATAGAETIKLTYANFFPPFHVQSQLAESWCKEVEKRTGGAVKIDYYPGGTLSKAPQIYDNVEMGVADIGMTVLAYSRGRFPVLGAVDLPMGYTSGVVATKVANAVLEKFNPKEVQDTKVMFLHAHGPGYINTVSKAVHNMEDMKGLKIRSTGMSTILVKALGGTPVAQSMGDAYQSLQKGVVDGSAHPLEANKGWKLGEVLKYCIAENSVAYTTNMIVTMNKSKWNSLSPEIQKTISEINAEWAVKHGEAWDQIDVEGRNFIVDRGNEVITLSPEESLKWKNAVRPSLDEYAEDLNKKGLPGSEIVQFIMDSIKQLQ